MTCHVNNGPWKDDTSLVIDVVDKATGKSLKQADGTFLITARRGEDRTVLTVIGTSSESNALAPYRNAWVYIDPVRIQQPAILNKFAPGWSVNLPMSCRLVGDVLKAYPDAHVSSLPMTIRAGDDAQDAEIELQVMLTKGASVKDRPHEGMVGSYFERRIRLKVE
ncbi:MAG: hypothetical protein ACREUA_07045 [Burkholderiales bacterium]